VSRKNEPAFGEIVVENHMWFISPLLNPSERIPVNKVDAWNFDVYAGLKVTFKKVRNEYRIVSRQNNKKYVKIKKENLERKTNPKI
jgi:hypothetical protein